MVLPLHMHHPRHPSQAAPIYTFAMVTTTSPYLDNLLEGLDGWTADVGGIIYPVNQIFYKEALVFS